MNPIITSITLDFAKKGIPVTIYAKQHDNESRFIEITPLNNGLIYELADDVVPRLQMTKPDGHSVFDDATTKNGRIIIKLTEQILAAAGIAVAEIGLYKDGSLLSSQIFYIDIIRSAFDKSAPESSDEFNALTDALAKVDSAVESAVAATNTAAEAANTAAQRANTAAANVKDGTNGTDGISATHSWNGTTLTITSASGTSSADLKGDTGETGATGANGQDGYTPVKGVDYFTEADKEELIAAVIESLGGSPIFGYVDENNNIVVSGSLSDGTYSVKYEMADGSTVNIGNLTLDSTVYYSITNSLANCTINNSATEIAEGESYSAAITANDGYELKSVSVKMGGATVSVTNGVINIASVTGDIVITAVAEEIKTVEPVTVDIALTDGIRIGSDGTDRTQAGYCATEHIDLTNVPKPCTIHLTKARWAYTSTSDTGMVMYYATKANGTKLVGGYTNTSIGAGYFNVAINDTVGTDVTVTVNSDDVATLRFSGHWANSSYSDNSSSFSDANTKATLTYTPAS